MPCNTIGGRDMMLTVSESESKQINRNVMHDGRQIAIMHANIQAEKNFNLMIEILDQEAAKQNEDEIRSAFTGFITEMQRIGSFEGLFTYHSNG